jgi:hypothetical protein
MWEDSPKGFGCGNESSAEKKAQGGVQKKKGSRGRAKKKGSRGSAKKKRLKGESQKKRLKGECRLKLRRCRQGNNNTTGNNQKVILASLVLIHPGSASPFRTVIRLLLRAMGIRCSVSRLTRSPNGLTTLDTSLPAQCAMATPSLDRAIPRQGGIRPSTYVRQVQPALEPAWVTERRYSFPLLHYAEAGLI